MKKDPFTIRIFVPDGDPDGVRIIDKMNWTGIGIAFPRAKWPEIKKRTELSKAVNGSSRCLTASHLLPVCKGNESGQTARPFEGLRVTAGKASTSTPNPPSPLS